MSVAEVHASPTNRAWGYVDWRPQSKTRPILDAVQAIFTEYAEQLPLTIRQVFYRLVGVHEYPKSEQAYARLLYLFDRARRARLIPWEWVRDDGIQGADRGRVPPQPPDPREWLDDYLDGVRYGWMDYAVHPTTGQPKRIEVWCEAAGMRSQLERVASRYGVPVFSGGGAESLSARRNLISRTARQPELPTVVLHIGDHDEAGEDIFAALSTDVAAFLADDAPDAKVTFERVAVTPAQIVALDLPTAPPKEGRSQARRTRTERWMAEGNSGVCQAEALPPDQLAALLDDALQRHTDAEVLASMKTVEQEAKAWLRAELEHRFPEE